MDFIKELREARMGSRKPIKKLGTLKIGVVETTPVVWQGRLLRFEWIRNHGWGKASGVTRDVGYYHFVDMETEESVCPPFGLDHSFGCCYEENGVMTVIGVEGPGGGQVLKQFTSSDLIHWEQSTVYHFDESYRLYNTSLCKSDKGYVLTLEVLNKAVGSKFTNIFFTSENGRDWRLLPVEEYAFFRDRYSACPTVRYYGGYYYLIYLESAPFHRWLPYIVRTKDLLDFEPGLVNPVFFFSDEDKRLIHPERFSEAEKDYVQNAVNCNNSDVDLCEYQGRTVILYSWGNQLGKEFLALAEYDGSEREFLESFFE